MRLILRSLCALALAYSAAVALAGCETTPVPTQAYSPTATDQAVLIHYDNSWSPIFDKVDLSAGISVPKRNVRTEGLPEQFTYTSKRVTPDIQQKLGIKPAGGRTNTGYRVTVWAPGDYAMVGIVQPNSNGLASWVSGICFTGAAPVFRLEAGVINVFEVQRDIQARVDAGSSYDPTLIKREEDRIRSFLEEYPALKGEVRLAPVVASIQYYKSLAPSASSLCDRANRFVVGPPRPLPPPPPK